MMAMESSQHHQPYLASSCFSTMDPTLFDPFVYHVDSMSAFDPDATTTTPTTATTTTTTPPPSLAQSYFDASASLHDSTPSVATSQAADTFIPTLSTASAAPSIASASSSVIGSPYSGTALQQEPWVDTSNGLGLPGAVMSDLFPNDYMGNALDPDPAFCQEKFSDSFVDPSLIQPINRQQPYLSPSAFQFPEPANFSLAQTNFLPSSPVESSFSPLDYQTADQPSQSHYSPAPKPQEHPVSTTYDRRSSVSSLHSRRSQHSPAASSTETDEEGKEKGRCPHPGCGRVFKDLKAHMLTHQSQRPEKCPIVTCEYHVKGFARKYDKNRHTLTHYKGTMVCGFCPGPGSPAEKCFNRADVFKRHLTSVHGVEQTPPNSRKKSPTASSNKKITDYCSDATGKCSTCSLTFNNAQDFYEHLDDCVLRVVQQEEPSEAINQQRLAEVDSDEEVKKTMEKHSLLVTAGTVDRSDDENDDDDDDENESSSHSQWTSGRGCLKPSKTDSKGRAGVLGKNGTGKAITNPSRRRKNRRNYPLSWGCPSSSINTKKRVLCVFDGPRRLWKDEMMLDNQFEVRLRLPGAGDGTNRDAYITDLDLETMRRAEGVFSATEEERGPWLDGPSTCLIGPSAVPLSEFSRPQEDEVDFDEIMA